MAAVIAMPVVAFILLMSMALYEDRMLPRGVAADPPEREPGESPEQSAARPVPSLITDPRLARGSNCRVRHADARPVRRPHGPAGKRTGRAAPAASEEPAEPAPAADMPDTVPYPLPGQVTGAPGDAA